MHWFCRATVTKYHKLIGCLERTETCSLTVPKTRRWKSRQGHILFEGSRKDSLLASSWFLVVARNPCHSLLVVEF